MTGVVQLWGLESLHPMGGAVSKFLTVQLWDEQDYIISDETDKWPWVLSLKDAHAVANYFNSLPLKGLKAIRDSLDREISREGR